MQAWPFEDGKPILTCTRDALDYAKAIHRSKRAVNRLTAVCIIQSRLVRALLNSKHFSAQNTLKEATYLQFIKEALYEINQLHKGDLTRIDFRATLDELVDRLDS